MNVIKALELMKQYEKCPQCGNELIGNGEGALIVDENTFVRNCKCGFSVKVELK